MTSDPLAPTWEPRIVLQMLVAADDAAQPRGIMDCVDNDGKPYQSAHMAKLVEHARALVSAPTTIGERQAIAEALRPYIGAHLVDEATDAILSLGATPLGAGWIALTADRVLYVDQGKETILCDRLPSPITLVIKNPARADGAFLPAADTCELQLPLADREGVSATPTTNAPVTAQPIDMLLFCPKCGKQHIDEPEPFEATIGIDTTSRPDWSNPPHRSHLCHDCGCIWRPADVATNGVATIATLGKADTWSDIWSAPAALRQTLPIHGEMREALEPEMIQEMCAKVADQHCVGLRGIGPVGRAQVNEARRIASEIRSLDLRRARNTLQGSSS